MPILHYQIYGEQNRSLGAVVLLHGLFGMSDNLSSLAKSLAEHCLVIVPDLINHGQSPHRMLMSYPTMADDVFLLLDSLDVQCFSLLGHSMGGKVAMQMATLYPERIERLVVVDIAPVAYIDRHSAIMTALEQALSASINNRKEIELSLRALGVEEGLIPFFIKNAVKNTQGEWRWRFALPFIRQAYVDISAAPKFVHIYSGDVLFIKGQLSDYILPAHADTIRHWFSKAHVKIINSAGHWLHAEKPTAFKKIVFDFLGHV